MREQAQRHAREVETLKLQLQSQIDELKAQLSLQGEEHRVQVARLQERLVTERAEGKFDAAARLLTQADPRFTGMPVVNPQHIVLLLSDTFCNADKHIVFIVRGVIDFVQVVHPPASGVLQRLAKDTSGSGFPHVLGKDLTRQKFVTYSLQSNVTAYHDDPNLMYVTDQLIDALRKFIYYPCWDDMVSDPTAREVRFQDPCTNMTRVFPNAQKHVGLTAFRNTFASLSKEQLREFLDQTVTHSTRSVGIRSVREFKAIAAM